MGKNFLIDTNVLIDFQVQRLPLKSYEYVINVIDSDFTISFISYIEFLGYKDASSSMTDFIKLANVIRLDQGIVDETISLRKTTRIKLPDAIIAATAIAHKLVLISRNVGDFRNIAGIELIDPYQI